MINLFWGSRPIFRDKLAVSFGECIYPPRPPNPWADLGLQGARTPWFYQSFDPGGGWKKPPMVWWCFVVVFLFQMYYYIHTHMCIWCVCARFIFVCFYVVFVFFVDIQIDKVLWTCWTSTRWTAKISTICSIRWKPALAILHPWCLTWNLKISPWKRMFLSTLLLFFSSM